MAISHIGVNSGSRSTTGGNITVSAHASTADGDIMIAVLSHNGFSAGTRMSGWTYIAVETTYGDDNWTVAWRRFTTGDTTWTFAESDSDAAVWGISTYRGVNETTPFLDEDFAEGTSHVTPTLNNTNASAWYVIVYGEMSANDSTKSWTSDIGTERIDVDTTVSTDNPSIALYDSNGTIATGNYAGDGTVTATASDGWAWLGFLQPPASGTSNQLMMQGVGT